MLSRHPLRRSIGRRIVARIDTVTWRGRLAAYSCGWLELKDASVMDPVTGAPPPPPHGLILLPETRIDFIQIAPEAD